MPRFSIRLVKEKDLDRIYEIQAKSYGNRYLEEKDAFLEIFSFYEEGCFCAEMNDRIIAYVLSFPWIRGITAPLNDK